MAYMDRHHDNFYDRKRKNVDDDESKIQIP
jgi:hypothetical protein